MTTSVPLGGFHRRPRRAALGRFLLAGIVALGAAGCQDDPPTTAKLEVCSARRQPVAITTAATDAATTFSWSPACRGSEIKVLEDPSGQLVWRIRSRSYLDPGAAFNPIAPPVTYGVVPEGTTQLTAPAALVLGSSYIVVLVAIDEPETLRELSVGAGRFTR